MFIRNNTFEMIGKIYDVLKQIEYFQHQSFQVDGKTDIGYWWVFRGTF